MSRGSCCRSVSAIAGTSADRCSPWFLPGPSSPPSCCHCDTASGPLRALFRLGFPLAACSFKASPSRLLSTSAWTVQTETHTATVGTSSANKDQRLDNSEVGRTADESQKPRVHSGHSCTWSPMLERRRKELAVVPNWQESSHRQAIVAEQGFVCRREDNAKYDALVPRQNYRAEMSWQVSVYLPYI